MFFKSREDSSYQYEAVVPYIQLLPTLLLSQSKRFSEPQPKPDECQPYVLKKEGSQTGPGGAGLKVSTSQRIPAQYASAGSDVTKDVTSMVAKDTRDHCASLTNMR